jgi:mono/diheme cytochrome c family protein
MKYPLVALLPLLLSTAAVSAQTLPGDPEAGRALALRACAGCHVVPNQRRETANEGVPTFASIARGPGVTEISLRVFLQTSHPPMPDLMLARSEIDDVVSYILSLR